MSHSGIGSVLVCAVAALALACSAGEPEGEHVRSSSASEPLVWGPIARIQATDGPSSFGTALAVSGTTLLVGAYGAAYVFERSGNTWTQQAKLTASTSASGFGEGLDLEAGFAIVGAGSETTNGKSGAGAAYPFTRSGTTWVPEAKLLPPDGGAQYGGFGSVVSISGTTAIIAGGKFGASKAYVFIRGASSWTPQATLTPSDGWSNDRYGSSVSINGDTAVVGAIIGPQAVLGGSVYVYTRSGTTWTQSRRLNVTGSSNFGSAVDLTATHLLVGAEGTNSYRGSAYLYGVGGWTVLASLTANDGADNDWFGTAVAFGGTRALIGAPYNAQAGSNAGAAYMFSGSGFPFDQKLLPGDTASGIFFGKSVAIGGNTAYVGGVGATVYAYELFDPIGCSSGSQCATGFCADGVCCDRPCNGACDAGCRTTTGASRDGICAVDPYHSAGSPSCAPYRCGANGGACPTTCFSDTDCSAGNFCSSSACVPKRAAGSDCTAAVQCASSFCVDGKCCSTSCSTICMACNQARTGQPDGTCAGVSAGTDPDNECKDGGSPTCQNNGLCDGGGACQKYAVTTGCTPQACTTGTECASGFCADGICCDSACNGTCVACKKALKASGEDGLCGPVADGTDPHETCALGAGFPQSCLADGLCNGSGACRTFAPATTTCGSTVCSGGLVVGDVCNGAGQCVASTGQACAPFVCRTDACVPNCTGSADCTADAYCTAGGACAFKKAAGDPCQNGVECQSGFCVDAVCCTSPCGSQCEACNVAPNVGACVPVSGEPRSGRTPCTNAGSECGGVCNGVDTSRCEYPGTSTSCGVAECVNGTAQAHACDGVGECTAENPVQCSPFACAAGECKTRCTGPSDCASGFVCDARAGACVPSTSTCSADGQQVVDATGVVEKECAPYGCVNGQCENSCDATSDCVSGYVCRIEGSQGTCTPIAADQPSDDAGCGCRVHDGRRPASALFLAIALLLGLRRRNKPHA